MPNWIILSLILIVIPWCWLLWACLTAPEGWEDEDGFHFGRPDE